MLEVKKILADAGYEVASGADGVRAMIADKAKGSKKRRCSGWRVFPNGDKCSGCGDCQPGGGSSEDMDS